MNDIPDGNAPAREEAIRRFAETRHADNADWSAPDESTRGALDDIANMWRSLDGVAEDPAILAFRAKARARLQPETAPASSIRRWRWLGAGGAMLTATMVGAIVLTTQGHLSEPPSSTAASPDRVIVSGNAPPQTFTLSDGSRLTLDAQSAVRFATTPDGARRVTLDRGRAFFDVAHRSDRPFQVRAGDAVITDIGTHFDVSLNPDGINVAVLQGMVQIDRTPPGASPVRYVLRAGDLFAMPGGAARITHENLAEGAQWRAGALSFNERPLGEVIAALNRYLARPLVLQDPQSAGLKVSGVFRVDDPQGLVRALNAIGHEGMVTQPGCPSTSTECRSRPTL